MFSPHAKRLSNVTKRLVRQHIQANIAASLKAVSLDTPDNVAIQPAPSNSYFEYDGIKGYQLPAVFTIVEDIDFRLAQQNANHVSATVNLHIAVLLEDKDTARVVKKADYWLDALFDVLQNAQLEDLDEKVKLVVRVERARFSPEYIPEAGKGEQMFRKEVHFECAIEHWTN